MTLKKNVYEKALASLAERAVVAEYKVETLVAEVEALKRQRRELEERIEVAEGNSSMWWAAFWRAQGFTEETLVKARMDIWKESERDAKRLIEGMKNCSYAVPNANGGYWAWPK